MTEADFSFSQLCLSFADIELRSRKNKSTHTVADVGVGTHDSGIVEAVVIDAYDVNVDAFIAGFSQLVRLFDLMGKAFTFVSSEIKEKLEMLVVARQRLIEREGGDASKFETIQSIVAYEVSNKLHKTGLKPANFTRTLLRLIWALEFIGCFLDRIRTGEATHAASSTAYSTTLGTHHPWTVRKVVQLALSFIPARSKFLESLSLKEEDQNEQLSRLTASIWPMYNMLHALYKSYDILDVA